MVLAGCGPEAEELVPTAPLAATNVPTVQPTGLPSATNTTMPSLPINTPEPALTATVHPPNEPEFHGILKYDIEKWNASMAFSQDGKKMAILAETVQLWDVDTLEIITKFRFQDPDSDNYAATKAVFSSDGSLLAVNVYDKRNEYFVPDVDNRLLVFDVVSGELLQEWQLEDAIMPDSSYYSEPYEIRLNAMEFIQGSSRLVFAIGNRLEIRDVLRDEDPVVIELGKEMYADQISIREDGDFVSVLMNWYKDHSWPSTWRDHFRAQVWHINTQTLRRDIRFEEVRPGNESMYLVGSILMHRNDNQGTLGGQEMYDETEYQFPFRRGLNVLSADATRLLAFRYGSSDRVPENEQGIEIWDTYHGGLLFDFEFDFPTDKYYYSRAAFSTDNCLLAILLHDQVYIWNLPQDIEVDLYESD